MARIGKFFRLPPEEKKIFLQALLLLFYCRFSLQFKEFKEVVNHFNKQAGHCPTQANSGTSSDRVVALLEAAGKLVPFSTCLSRALAGIALMRRCGYSPVLHIGVAKENDNMLEAHAWLSLNGKIIIGNCSDLERFEEFPFIFNGEKR